jgi:hypothetical protein
LSIKEDGTILTMGIDIALEGDEVWFGVGWSSSGLFFLFDPCRAAPYWLLREN